MGQVTLLMPWFQSPANRNRATLECGGVDVEERLSEKGLRHGDVAWRNMGIYTHEGETKAVVFDMQKVHRDHGGLDAEETHADRKGLDWVEAAVRSLSTKLEKAGACADSHIPS